MKIYRWLASILLLTMLWGGMTAPSYAQGPGLQAAVGTAFTYQGQLTDDQGAPLTGQYDFEFKLYDGSGGGAGQIGSTVTVDNKQVEEGRFTVSLDFGANAFTGDARWLDISVRDGGSTGNYTHLSPRQELTPAPYAQYAGGLDWSDLDNVPGDLADGDDGTTYSAGAGLSLSGTAFSVDFAGSGSASTVARSDHDHLGQTWVGNDDPLYLSGAFDSANNAPAPLMIENSVSAGVFISSTGTTGVAVAAAGRNGVGVGSATEDGLSVLSAGEYGVYVSSAGNDGLHIGQAGSPASTDPNNSAKNGVEVAGAEDDGVYVGYAGDDGLQVSSAGDEGVEVGSAGWNGVRIGTAGRDGVYVGQAGSPTDQNSHSNSNGIEVAGAEYHGVYVGHADHSGVYVESANNDGVHVESADFSGLQVDSAGGDGVDVESADYNGVHVISAGTAGVRVGSAGGHGVRVDSAGDEGVFVQSADDHGILVTDADDDNDGIGEAGYFVGDVTVTGNLSKGSGSFTIDHPQNPENKTLSHSFVESPDMMNVYNGNVTTDDEGYATVTLPDYFEALNIDYRYQLTVIGTFAQAIIAEEIEDNQFVIQTDEPNVKVSWQVTGIRNDPYAQENRIEVEAEKPEHEQGLYLHPEAYDQPASKGIGYNEKGADQ